MKYSRRAYPNNGQVLLRTTFTLLAVLTVTWLSGRSQAAASTADINPYAIEIDANLFPSGATGRVDWVKDSLPNTDPASLSNSIATGIITNLTGAPGGKG